MITCYSTLIALCSLYTQFTVHAHRSPCANPVRRIRAVAGVECDCRRVTSADKQSRRGIHGAKHCTDAHQATRIVVLGQPALGRVCVQCRLPERSVAHFGVTASFNGRSLAASTAPTRQSVWKGATTRASCSQYAPDARGKPASMETYTCIHHSLTHRTVSTAL